jgi:hypothetical protein
VVLPDFDYAMVPGSHKVELPEPLPPPPVKPVAPTNGVKVAAARIAERRNGSRPESRPSAVASARRTNGTRPHKPGTRPAERARPGKRPAARRPAPAVLKNTRRSK